MDALVARAWMIWLSLHPSPASETSAFNKIRAFSRRCAGLLPFRISVSSSERSPQLNRTTYFFTAISFAAMIASIARVATKANHQILSTSLKRATSRPLLLKMAQTYRRPLVTFYMSAPPRKGDRGEDFRNVPDRQTNAEALVDALVRDIRARQSIVRTILLDEEEAQPLPFVGSIAMTAGVAEVLAWIRQPVRLDLAEFRAQATPESASALLRSKVEAAGIFVLLVGNLGSHHTAIDVAAFRGFALADPIAPFVVINDQDARAAWSFTLVHELAHIWLGTTGVSGAFADAQIERFCNSIAGSFL